jgi:hypothetical protein
MFGILDQDQPVSVSREEKYHSRGAGACEDSWGFYGGGGETLKEAENNGYRACEQCSFEEVSIAQLVRQIFTR